MAQLVTITGPIAAGKNAVASLLADGLTALGRSAVLVDVDDVAAMVAGPGAAAAGLWFAAHLAMAQDRAPSPERRGCYRRILCCYTSDLDQMRLHEAAESVWGGNARAVGLAVGALGVR